MMAQEETARLTQTGAGTPGGKLMRRFWQPAALSVELASDKPLPVTLLGEELVLFREGGGNPALIGRYCAHQGVDMIYGRVESDGIRCMYHGWLFDACGKVVVRGDWFPGGEQRMSVGQPAYPCAEIGGVILAYMGPGEAPGLPAHEFLVNPQTCVEPKKNLRADNFLQAVLCADEAPGGARFVVPNLVICTEPSSAMAIRARWHVPVDDISHAEFTFDYLGKSPIIGDPLHGAPEALLKAMEVAHSGESRGDQP